MSAKTSFWRDRPVLVTGASGFLGGWLIKSLLEVGADPICPVRDWVPASQLLGERFSDRVNLARGDLTDREFLERVIGEYEVKTVFHLAAQTIVTIANRNPLSTFESNIRGTWCLLEACRNSPTVQEIIVASSDKAYGEQQELPYSENLPLQGTYPYDVSKACAEMVGRSYFQTYGLPVAITRCGNFFGGGDLNWNRLVPGTIRSVLRGRRPLIRSDGDYIRDYFYIEDGAAAYMLLAEQLAEKPQLAGEAFNFSSEEQLTVSLLVGKILAVMQSNLEPEVLGEADHEIRHQYLDATKARRLLRWTPLFSLEEALQRTVAWYREHLDG